jgi:hypothetical protein
VATILVYPLSHGRFESNQTSGVQIQEGLCISISSFENLANSFTEVLAELHRVQESAYNLRDATRQDYLARAKICSKIAKYPNIEDYTV